MISIRSRVSSSLLACLTACLAFGILPASLRADKVADLVIAVGAGGEDDYATTFADWAEKWRAAGKQGGAGVQTIGIGDDGKDCAARLLKLLADADKESPEPFWLVLLGHGTWDGKDAKFNLHGDDITSDAFATALKPFVRPVVVVCGFSTSGAFLAPLSAPGRVIVTATRAGGEHNYARFGGYLADAIGNQANDLDKDGQTSLLEAFVAASRATADFYKGEGRLATEHSLLDDNGDGAGTPGDWFRGVRATKKPAGKSESDGSRANQIHLIRSNAERELKPEARAERDRLERKVEELRAKKSELKEAEYLAELEKLMLDLARIQRDSTRNAGKPNSDVQGR